MQELKILFLKIPRARFLSCHRNNGNKINAHVSVERTYIYECMTALGL